MHSNRKQLACLERPSHADQNVHKPSTCWDILQDNTSVSFFTISFKKFGIYFHSTSVTHYSIISKLANNFVRENRQKYPF